LGSTLVEIKTMANLTKKSLPRTAHAFMTLGLLFLKDEAEISKSRENSLAITKIEEAMMWNNKDRVIKGELAPSETHVE